MRMIDADKLLEIVEDDEFANDVSKNLFIKWVERLCKEKNTPRIPIENTETIPKTYTCPECGASVTYKEDVQNPVFGGMSCTIKRDRCIYCGQMIKWGE